MKQAILTKSKHSRLERDKFRTGLILLIPSLVLCITFMVVPLVNVIRYSFTDWNGISDTYRFVGFENYRGITKIDGFKDMMIATLIYAVGHMITTVFCAFIIALALDKKGKGRLPRNLLRTLWFLPCLLSATVIGLLWKVMYNFNNGVINKMLVALGGSPVNWLETRGLANVAIIIAATWVSIGMSSVVFMAGLQGIPQDLYEAAALDGATPGQQLRHITLPMMASSITINVITATIGGFKAYELPLNLTGGGPGKSTLMITQRISFFAFEDYNYGFGSALSIILLIIIALISLIQLIYLKSKEDIY